MVGALTTADIETLFRPLAGCGAIGSASACTPKASPQSLRTLPMAMADRLASAGSDTTGAAPRPPRKASERSFEPPPRPARHQRSNGYDRSNAIALIKHSKVVQAPQPSEDGTMGRSTASPRSTQASRRYYVGLDPKDALRLPTNKLTMRTMRHTCITLNHDAGVPRELIRDITGCELETIDQVLKCCATVIADQAAAASISGWPTRQRGGAPGSTRTCDGSPCSFSLGSQQRRPKMSASVKRMNLGKWRARRDSNS